MITSGFHIGYFKTCQSVAVADQAGLSLTSEETQKVNSLR